MSNCKCETNLLLWVLICLLFRGPDTRITGRWHILRFCSEGSQGFWSWLFRINLELSKPHQSMRTCWSAERVDRNALFQRPEVHGGASVGRTRVLKPKIIFFFDCIRNTIFSRKFLSLNQDHRKFFKFAITYTSFESRP